MSEFVFTSPGVKFKEKDITFVTRNVGITTLGLVGETLKGPAFEPIYIQDKTMFQSRFGAQSTKRFSNGSLQYLLPYYANTYTDESNQLWVTRVLGLSGYDAGTEWAITLSAGLDPSTLASGSTSTIVDNFTNNSYLGVNLYTVSDTGSTFTGFTKTGDVFNGTKYDFTVLTITGGSGTVSVVITNLSGSTYTEYDNMVLATIRSRGYVLDNLNAPATTIFDAESLEISGNTTIVGTGDMFGEFVISATKGSSTESNTVSLNPNASNYIKNVLGSEPKDKKNKIWVKSTFADLIKKLDSYGDSFNSFGLTGVSPYGFGIKTELIESTTSVYTDYKTQYKTPETPWIVSEVKGTNIDRLFKFISISDGDSANEEIKVSITGINPETNEFNVVIRSFYDTDANPIVLESFSRCTMTKGLTNYIAQRIGTSDGEYSLQSKYVMLELAPDLPALAFPAGFEGYQFNNYSDAVTESGIDGITPKIFYKTSYDVNERASKIYLGVSENAYSGYGLTGTGINPDFFKFNNWRNGDNNTASGFTKTKGFHLDSGATGTYVNGTEVIGEFEVGAGSLRTVVDILDSTQTYYSILTRKFTVAFSGGFDGWDVNRTSRTHGDNYRQLGIYDGVDPLVPTTTDFQAWTTAINTFSNPEQVTINLFATPGINWSDNNVLVLNTIEMIEQERTDSLYIIDTPDIDIPIVIGSTKTDVVAANDIVDLFSNSGIDSSYSCTYFPWIQVRDTQNNVNLFIPPTGEVAKAMAFTDNTTFPWFAPAGLQRGVTDAKKSKYRLSLEARDVLYKGRINPIADFADVGTAIFGQKTLQVKESALDRINVRRLLLQIKVLISNIAIRLVFEQNDQTTKDQFISKVTPKLDTIKRERGLLAFDVKMDDSINTPETSDRNELYGEIGLQPTRAVEYIGIGFTISPSGASFTDL